MYKSTRSRGQVEQSKSLSILKGIIIGYILTFIMLILLTYLLFKYDISNSQIYIGIVMTYIFATLLTGITTGKKVKENKWVWGALSGFIYFIILFLISILINKEVTSIKEIITMLALCVGGGTLGGMFS